MKVVFWLLATVIFIADVYLATGVVNIYFRNYNGGPRSSSGSIVYPAAPGVLVFAGGLFCYCTGRLKTGTLIMGTPIALTILYLFFVLILPYLMGERMN